MTMETMTADTTKPQNAFPAKSTSCACENADAAAPSSPSWRAMSKPYTAMHSWPVASQHAFLNHNFPELTMQGKRSGTGSTANP